MIYILILLLFFFIGFALIATNRDLLSPFFVSSSICVVNAFILIFYSRKWCFELHGSTVLILIMSLVCLGFGELFGRITTYKNIHKFNGVIKFTNKEHCDENLNINSGFIYFAIGFCLITFVLYFYETYLLSLIGGGSFENISLMIKYARIARVSGVTIGNTIVSHMYLVSKVIENIFACIFLYNKIFIGDKSQRIIILVPVVLFLITSVLTTGRTELMWFIISLVVMGMVLYNKRFRKKRNILKLFGVMLGGACSFLVIFYLLGNLTGKTQNYKNIFDNIATYMSSSLVGLDIFLQNPQGNTETFGAHTLFGIYSFLQALGFDIPLYQAPLEFFNSGALESNLYTPFRRYIQDFGYLGLFLIQVIIGYLYSKMLVRAYYAKGIMPIILIGYLYYPIIEMVIEERFFMDIVTMNTVYTIIYFGIYLRFLFSNQLNGTKKVCKY